MRSRLLALFVSTLMLGLVGTATAAPGAGGGGDRVDVIVVLHDGADARDAARDAARTHHADVSFVYEHALQGFAASVPQGRLTGLRNDARVDYVEADQVRTIQAQTIPTGIHRTFATGNGEIDIDGTDDHRVDVGVAIIDTGIDYEHPDLDVRQGVDCSGGSPFRGSCKAGGDDDHYHGTHVAGTVGAIDNGGGVVGIAPGAALYPVKVLSSNGSGFTSWIVAGIDWVAANAAKIQVANMSLGGSGFNQAEYDAIQGAVNKGVAFAVAAGNSDADANNYSPAAFDNVLTVSALADFDGLAGAKGTPTCREDQDDTLADFSNWGSAVQIAAPGVCILSTYPIEQGSYGTISGTSMASPHAAGALALLASNGFTRSAAGVQSLYDTVIAEGNLNWTDDSGDGIHEPLLDVSDTTVFNPTLVAGGGGGGGTGNAAPTAAFTADCASDPTCSFDGSGSSDTDGTIASYAWDFGDGTSGSGVTASHSYTANGDYTVTLTVTDDAGATDSTSMTVSITQVSTDGISLSTSGYKVQGRHRVDLTWTGATSTNVDVYRNGALLTTTANDGAYTDATNNRGGATYTYQVCEAGTTTCSNESTVVF